MIYFIDKQEEGEDKALLLGRTKHEPKNALE